MVTAVNIKGGIIMKGSTILAIALTGMLGSSQANCAARMPVDGTYLRLKGSLNCPYIPAGGGRVYLQVAMETGELRRHDRRPLNVALVLDRSGSMAAEGKIENAKAALRTVIDQLRSDDILSIVIYDDEVDVLRPAGRVGNKADVRRLVDEIQPIDDLRSTAAYRRRVSANLLAQFWSDTARRGRSRA